MDRQFCKKIHCSTQDRIDNTNDIAMVRTLVRRLCTNCKAYKYHNWREDN